MWHWCDSEHIQRCYIDSVQRHRHDSFQTWLMSTCARTYLDVWHDSFICVTWLCVTSLIHSCERWLISTFDRTRSYLWHDSFKCVTWLTHMCDLTHSSVWHDSFQRVTWLVHTSDMPRSYMWHVSLNSRRHLRTRHVSQPYDMWHIPLKYQMVYAMMMKCMWGRYNIMHSNVSDDACMSWRIQVYETMMKCICDITHSNVWNGVCNDDEMYVRTIQRNVFKYLRRHIQMYELTHSSVCNED